MRILENLEKFLLTEIAVDLGKKSLDPNEDLLEQGIIDSLGIMKLVLFLEESYGIQVDDQDITPENFQCLSSMVKYVEQQLQVSKR
jgi:acyl carrier protein